MYAALLKDRGSQEALFLPDIKRKDMDCFAAVGAVGCETYFSKPFPYRQAIQPLVMIGHRERLRLAVFIRESEGKGAHKGLWHMGGRAP